MARRKAVVDFEIQGQEGLKSLKNLGDKVKALRKEWVSATEAKDRYEKLAEFKKANEELNRHRQMVNSVSSSWSSFKGAVGNIATGVFGGNVLLGIGEKILNFIPKLISGTSQIADQISDIKKSTGLLDSELIELNDDLDRIDTRTPREELRKLAKEAGKLGKESVEDVREFVEEANMISVALSEDLGDDAILKIGKAAEAYSTSMLKIGSSINSVGGKSSAAEQYLVDFLARLQGSAVTANIAAPDIIGYGAVLDKLGLQVEMSGTALSTFFLDFVKDSGKFERAAGMQAGSLKELIGEKGTNEGFLGFIDNLKKSTSSQAEFLQKLEDIGIDGSRGAAVFLSLANNLQTVREQQAIANTEFEKGTSIINEYNIKNTNQAAIWEKIGKWWEGFWSGGAVRSFVNDLVEGFGLLVGVVSKAELANRKFAESKGEFQKLTGEILPLADRYDELRKKTKLSKEENEELKRIISQVTGVVIDAKTEVDKLGVAHGINTDKVREYIKVQKELLKYQNKSAIAETDKEIKDAQSKLEKAAKLQKAGKEIRTQFTGNESKLFEYTLSDKDKKAIERDIRFYNSKLTDLNALKKGLTGDYLNDPKSSATIGTGDSTEERKGSFLLGGNYQSQSDKDSVIKKAEAGQKEIEKLRNAFRINLLQDNEKEIQAIKDKYATLRSEYSKHSGILIEMNKLEKQELQNLEITQERKRNEILKDFEDDRAKSQLTDQEREILSVKEKYEAIISTTKLSFEELHRYASLMQQDIDQVNAKWASVDKKQEMQDTIDFIDEIKSRELFNVDMEAVDPLANQEELNQRRLQIEEDYLLAKFMVMQEAGERDIDLERQIAEKHREVLRSTREAEQEATMQRKEEIEALKQAEFELMLTKLDAFSEGIAALRGFFKESSIINKAMFVAEKAFVIARIILNTQEEISNLRKASAIQQGTLAVIPGAGLAVAGFYAAKIQAARLNAALSIGIIAAQGIQQLAAKKEGGYTDANSLYGYTTGPTLFNYTGRPYIAGEAGREFIVSGASLQRPAVAGVAEMINTAQKTGDYSAVNALGTKIDTSRLEGLLSQLVSTQKALGADIKHLQSRPINFNYKAFEEFGDFIAEIKSSVTA